MEPNTLLRAKIVITILAIAIIVATGIAIKDFDYAFWGFVCTLVGMALAELWKIKKSEY